MSSVTFPPEAGGATYTDDSNSATGLAAGGHRTRFIPALKAVVDTAADMVVKRAEVQAIVDEIAPITTAVAASESAAASSAASRDAAGVSQSAAAESERVAGL